MITYLFSSFIEGVFKMERAMYPYNDYNIYIVYHKKEGRKYAVLVPVDKNSGLKRTTLSCARYLMSCKEKRFLTKAEEVDHIDNDKTNDSLDNLQLLSGYDNKIKYKRYQGRKYVLLECPICKVHFEIPKNKSYLQKGALYSCCSVKCKNKMCSITNSNKDKDKLNSLIKDNFIKEFVKKETS